MVKIFGITCLLLVAAGAEPVLACWMPFVRTLHNQTADGSMTVKSGKPCSIIFRSPGPTTTHRITQSPKNGSLHVSSVGRITYRSRSGYAGSDSFVYVRSGRDAQNNPSVRTVRISVTVTP